MEIKAETFLSRVVGKVSFTSSAVCLIWNVEHDMDWRNRTFQFSKYAFGKWDIQMQTIRQRTYLRDCTY